MSGELSRSILPSKFLTEFENNNYRWVTCLYSKALYEPVEEDTIVFFLVIETTNKSMHTFN